MEDFLHGKPKFVWHCNTLVNSKFFENFVIAVVVGNTVTLSMDYYGITEQLVNNLAIANIVFSTMFGLEMALKLTGTLTLAWSSCGGLVLVWCGVVWCGVMDRVALPVL